MQNLIKKQIMKSIIKVYLMKWMLIGLFNKNTQCSESIYFYSIEDLNMGNVFKK